MTPNPQTRRDLCFALAALGSLAAVPETLEAQAAASTPFPEPKLIHSELFPFDTLTPQPSANGGETRPVIRGNLATGEYVEVHETTLPPGQMPHPPHRHTHSEFLLIRDGRLEVTSDGQHGFIEAGGVIFTASGVLHGLKTVGDTPAHYFVVAVGVQKSLG
jgi:quercetin dioxygenase-like cupin family protein